MAKIELLARMGVDMMAFSHSLYAFCMPFAAPKWFWRALGSILENLGGANFGRCRAAVGQGGGSLGQGMVLRRASKGFGR